MCGDSNRAGTPGKLKPNAVGAGEFRLDAEHEGIGGGEGLEAGGRGWARRVEGRRPKIKRAECAFDQRPEAPFLAAF